jgi:hypothetical protein
MTGGALFMLEELLISLDNRYKIVDVVRLRL